MRANRRRAPDHVMVALVAYLGYDRETRGALNFITSDDAASKALADEDLGKWGAKIEDTLRYVKTYVCPTSLTATYRYKNNKLRKEQSLKGSASYVLN
jgi:hypothetical protein